MDSALVVSRSLAHSVVPKPFCRIKTSMTFGMRVSYVAVSVLLAFGLGRHSRHVMTLAQDGRLPIAWNNTSWEFALTCCSAPAFRRPTTIQPDPMEAIVSLAGTVCQACSQRRRSGLDGHYCSASPPDIIADSGANPLSNMCSNKLR